MNPGELILAPMPDGGVLLMVATRTVNESKINSVQGVKHVTLLSASGLLGVGRGPPFYEVNLLDSQVHLEFYENLVRGQIKD